MELLCQNGLTVIVTTHYIEEARTALRVGFMRSGRLLSEESPEELLKIHGLNTLEKVFLKLSQLEDEEKFVNEMSDTNSNTIAENKSDISLKEIKTIKNDYRLTKHEVKERAPNGHLKTKTNHNVMPPEYRRRQSLVNGLIQLREESIISDTNFFCRLFALTVKNFKQMSRNIVLLTFFVLLPSVEICLLIICIGQDVQKIPVSVYNPEKSSQLSEIFLKSIDKKHIHLIKYNTLESAINAVEVNDVWAVIYFAKNFSRSLVLRTYGYLSEEEDKGSGSIQLRIDMSNQVIGTQINKHMSKAYLKFLDNVSEKYEFGLNSMKPIVNNSSPVYGVNEASFNSFIAPGALIVVAYFATTVVTCHLLIKERTDGLVERSLVAGVTPLEFVVSHIILQLFLLCLQVGLKLMVAFMIFSVPNNGSIILATILTFLQGVCGLMFGLMVSAICPDEIYATTLCIGAFFPTVIIGGIFWPLESMPTALRYISQVLPSTLPIESLRSILLRGWNLQQTHVMIGFIITILWMLFFFINAITFFMKKL